MKKPSLKNLTRIKLELYKRLDERFIVSFEWDSSGTGEIRVFLRRPYTPIYYEAINDYVKDLTGLPEHWINTLAMGYIYG